MRLSRRNLIARLSTLAGGLVAARLTAQTTGTTQKPGIETRIKNKLKRKPVPPAPQPYVYFGTDTTRGQSKGIYVSRFDPATGHLTPPTLAAACVRPSWFAVGVTPTKHRVMYVCNEGEGAQAVISSLAIDAAGALHPLNQVSSGGAGPCYLSVDATNQSVFVADYSGSAVATYRVQPDGTLSQPVEHLDFKDARFGHTGPKSARQDAPHPHCAILTPDDRFLLVNDLGNDTITTFPVDASTAKLGPPHVHERRAGSGPRHLAFHPNGRWIYAVDELDNHVDQLLLNTTRGDVAHGFPPQALLTDTGHSISTLDAGFHGTNTAAEIAIAPSGRYVYVSNRGEDSLVVFTVDEATGALTVLQRIACGGKAPRHFTLDPTGNWLICGNQDSATVTVFARDQGTGRLNGPVQTMPLDSVQFTLFA
jgi:6-phosphogluconolactonase